MTAPEHGHPEPTDVANAQFSVDATGLPTTTLVLVRAGETVDILLDVTNPGLWMAHCHIAEHAQSGMMFSFDVAPRAGGSD